ncbi:unnamed protein product, partial [Adineta ricciae]
NLIPTTSTEIKYRYIQIPYVGKPSYVYSKKLLSIIKQYDPTAQVRTTYNTTNQTRRHFPTKDRLKPSQKAGVVYQISCSNCTKTYIGKTIRQSYRRVNEHEKDVVRALIFIHQASSMIRKRKTIKQHLNTIKGQVQKKPSTQPIRRSARLMNKTQTSYSQQQYAQSAITGYIPQSALGKHTFKTTHSINFDDIQILNQDQRHYRLLIKESLQIRSKKPALN